MKELRGADLTFRRLTDVQPFRSDGDSLDKLSQQIVAALPPRA